MPPFVITHLTSLTPEEAWERLTDWPAHGRVVPLTTISLDSPPGLVGTRFTARTSLGRLGFDDPMEVVEWEPPRRCRIEKRGRVLHGWAELSVEAAGTGARVTWREEAMPARLPRRLGFLTVPVGHLLFGRVVRKLA